MNPRTLAALAFGLALVLAFQVEGRSSGSAPREATLTCSGGERCTLSAYRGKPVVLFYEDRGSTELNQPLKDELFQRGRERGLLEAASVVAVANLSPYDFFPARDFALHKVRSLERKFGIPILVDWAGTLSAAPWNLPGKTASVLLLDGEGRVVWQRSGALSEKERGEFFHALADLLGVNLGEGTKR